MTALACPLLFLLLSVRASAACPDAGSSKGSKIYPVDDSDKDPSFKAFREQLLEAIRKRDRDFLLSILDPKIKSSFGGGDGDPVEEFKKIWELDRPGSSKVWSTLIEILNLGVTRENPDLFIGPYVYSTFNAPDPFEWEVIIRPSAEVRAEPDLEAPVIEKLCYDVVKIDHKGSVIDPNSERLRVLWRKITTPGGKAGYVAGTDIRSSVDYRAFFERKNGKWLLTLLVPGD